MFCPACGAEVSAVYEARPVTPVAPVGGAGSERTHVESGTVQPPAAAVAQPCGCQWSIVLARLRTIP